MALDIRTILSAVESHALASGYFAGVNGHEPKSPPTSGITAAVWVEQIGPARGGSGLNSTSSRLALFVRLYASLMQQEPDAIDPALMDALDGLMAAYSSDFSLGGLVRQVDLLGNYGDPLSARAGYLAEGGSEYRVMTIILPLIVNDLWNQEA
ncbi:hypothetical protein K4749_01360 [Streptomyces sp. TRM72054]|uniref:hypothetical protein n=1 Tax=Streptomyces sp. TRM72054 TaxID=2870562 RepID=UPI001C8C6945|nr:hypothetical protein [Streptomyces sp. TRM72054]MBX9392279.1 hypothetical protein [Streptomyces sp. TRM72054]